MTKVKNIFNIAKTVMLSRSDKKDYGVFMEAIDENTEKNFDKQIKLKDCFVYKTLSGSSVSNNAVYLYGEINLNNKEDIRYLDKFKNAILNPYDTGNWYYTSFDYKTGFVFYNENKQAYLGINFVSDYIEWFKQQYCKLGKPKRIIIYKKRIISPSRYD